MVYPRIIAALAVTVWLCAFAAGTAPLRSRLCAKPALCGAGFSPRGALAPLPASRAEARLRPEGRPTWCSPAALAASRDGRLLYVACATAARVDVFDTAAGKIVRSLRMPAAPTGLALAADGARLYVTCAAPSSKVAVVDLKSWTQTAIAAGHTAMAPALAGNLIYVCNRFDNDVSVIDTRAGRQLGRIKAVREPVAADLTPDGRYLFVANGLPAGRSDAADVAAEISVLDTAARRPVDTIRLPNGSTGLRGIRISPGGKFACVTHLLARYQLPTTQVERGWMETNAVTIIDTAARKRVGTVLLDEIDRGAANPWAVEWSTDGRLLAVTHAGTHELSLIDFPKLLEKLAKTGTPAFNDLAFLIGLRQRIPLAANGPRAAAVAGNRVWVAGYFSDTLEPVEMSLPGGTAAPAALLSRAPLTPVRKGEMLFNDGALCFQGWQSCASCHGPEARADGLNWDLLNDGIGNPKNARSLLLAHRTPPAMTQGIREDAEAAVRAGIRHILFGQRPEDDARAIDAWLRSLAPAPSPFLAAGKLSAAALRGRKLFFGRRTGCAACHPPDRFTDLKRYDVGTRSGLDTVAEFDTPTLVEVWRTAPYLHDGSAASLREVLTTANRDDRHGKTSSLSRAEIDDLLAYLLSL